MLLKLNAGNTIIKDNMNITLTGFYYLYIPKNLNVLAASLWTVSTLLSGTLSFTLSFCPHTFLPHLFIVAVFACSQSLSGLKTFKANPCFFSPQHVFFFLFLIYLFFSCNVGGLFVSFSSGIVCTGRVRLQVSPPSSPSSLLQTTWMSTTTKV